MMPLVLWLISFSCDSVSNAPIVVIEWRRSTVWSSLIVILLPLNARYNNCGLVSLSGLLKSTCWIHSSTNIYILFRFEITSKSEPIFISNWCESFDCKNWHRQKQTHTVYNNERKQPQNEVTIDELLCFQTLRRLDICVYFLSVATASEPQPIKGLWLKHIILLVLAIWLFHLLGVDKHTSNFQSHDKKGVFYLSLQLEITRHCFNNNET